MYIYIYWVIFAIYQNNIMSYTFSMIGSKHQNRNMLTNVRHINRLTKRNVMC